MALAFDTASSSASADGTGVTSLTWAHTCTGTDLFLLVAVQLNNDSSQTVSGVTYNGVAMTLVSALSNGIFARCELWKLVAPATGANNIIVSLSAADQIIGGAKSFTGCDQTTPLGTLVERASSNTPISDAITSAVGEIVMDCVSSSAGPGTSLTCDASQSQKWNTTANSGAGVPVVRGGGSTEAGGASVTMSWTCAAAQIWVHMGVSVKPVAAAAPAGNPATLLAD